VLDPHRNWLSWRGYTNECDGVWPRLSDAAATTAALAVFRRQGANAGSARVPGWFFSIADAFSAGTDPGAAGRCRFGVVAFRMLQLPPMLGYLAVGILIGPHALGLASDSGQTKYLAEFGVVFLMFSIGLEFSLAKLRAMKRLVFGLGGRRSSCRCWRWCRPAGCSTGCFRCPGRHPWRWAARWPCRPRPSSSKMLSERLELESEHGRNIISVLLFQDLAVVPLLIIIPALSRDPGDLAFALGLATVKIAVALGVIFFLGQRLMSRWFHVVAARRSQELFMLNLLLVTLGMAALTERLGLSMALGAFMAGMLISETPYRHQVEEDIKPFRDVLLGLFFVTIGMLLNVRVVFDHVWLVLGCWSCRSCSSWC
jgi:CPA2 family monovalent cation:H+ antiporter-2